MSGTRRNLLKGLLGAATVAATTTPNQLLAATMKPAAKVARMTKREKEIIVRVLGRAIDNYLDDAQETRRKIERFEDELEFDDEGNPIGLTEEQQKHLEEDNKFADDQDDLLQQLDTIINKLDNGEKLTPEEHKLMADEFEVQLEMYDSLEELSEDLQDADDDEDEETEFDYLEPEELKKLAVKLNSDSLTKMIETWSGIEADANELVDKWIAQTSAPQAMPDERPLNVTLDDTPKQLSGPVELPDDHQGPGLPDDLKSTVEEYAHGGSHAINRHLRGLETSDEAEQHVRNFDRIFGNEGLASTIDKPMTVYRGMGSSHLEGDLTGKHLYDKGYLSTSSRRSDAEDHIAGDDGGALLKITVPANTPFVHVNTHVPPDKMVRGGYPLDQNELLFNRGARLRVTSHQKNGDRHLIDAELIGHE